MAPKIAPLVAGAALVGFLTVGGVTLASAQEDTTTTTTPSDEETNDQQTTSDDQRDCDHDQPAEETEPSASADASSF